MYLSLAIHDEALSVLSDFHSLNPDFDTRTLYPVDSPEDMICKAIQIVSGVITAYTSAIGCPCTYTQYVVALRLIADCHELLARKLRT